MIARYWLPALLPVLFGAGSAFAAGTAPAMPGFWQLESVYGQGGGLVAATSEIGEALPPGTGVAQAQNALRNAGGECKTLKREPGALKCLIHQYSLADGAADDIRWTILMHTEAGVVEDLKVDRYVDRHGTN